MSFASRLIPSFLQRKTANLPVDEYRESSSQPEPKDDLTFFRASKIDHLETSGSSEGENVQRDQKPSQGNAGPSEFNKSMSSATLVRSLDCWNPETCVRLLRMPSVQNYTGLRKLISGSDKDWMMDFLEMGGLQVLLEAVDRLSSRKSSQARLEHTLLLLQCVSCFKAVSNSRNALEYIVGKKEYASRLAETLGSQNPLVKKQLFELLSTLCIHSEDGHHLTLDTLEFHRVANNLRYRFAVLLLEIKQAEVLPYVATVLALVNCVILGAYGFRLRTRIRSEFLAQGLLELLESLNQLPDEEIQLQCAVFSKSQLADQEHARSLGIRSSFSQFALFQSILDKVEDTPLASSFLILLQNLNQLDPGDSRTDYVWNVLEEITEKALINPEEVLKRWMFGEEEAQKYRRKSRGTQTWQVVEMNNSERNARELLQNSASENLCQKAPEDDEVSVNSAMSLDSGVPVSRTQSWTSNDINAPSPPPSLESVSEDTTPIKDEVLEQTSKERKSGGFFKAFRLSFSSMKNTTEQTNCSDGSSASADTLSITSTSPSVFPSSATIMYKKESEDSLNSEIPENLLEVPEEDCKNSKKSFLSSFNLSFFNKAKKYSVTKNLSPPSVKVHPPSPEIIRASTAKGNILRRDGLTSLEVKRSRKQMSQRSSFSGDTAKTSPLPHNESQSSITSPVVGATSYSPLDNPTATVTLRSYQRLPSCGDPKIPRPLSSPLPCPSEMPVKDLSSSSSAIELTSLASSHPTPPPPPPPPPSFSSPDAILRNPGSLHVPHSSRLNRSSWCAPSTFPGVQECNRQIYNTLPRPKSKMKTLNWAKIPNAHVNVQSIWGEISQDGRNVELDFETVEQLFCQKDQLDVNLEHKNSPKKRSPSQVSLLDSKRSLSIGIFLKQFKGGVDELFDHVVKCRHKAMGAERLRTLLKILPDPDEVKLLKNHKGDPNQLGVPEQFVIRLSVIDESEIRIESMLLLEEFPSTVEQLRDHVQAFLDACSELLNNRAFKDFLRLVLVTGNFMNAGSYAGNAVGFRLSTLPKLLDTRANKPRITLLHYLVEEGEKKNKDILSFTPVLLEHLNRCSRLTLDGLESEVSHLSKTLNRLDSHVQNGQKELREQFGSFVLNAKQQLAMLEEKISEIKKLTVQLAKRFCEDETKFQVEECLSILQIFCSRIKVAQAGIILIVEMFLIRKTKRERKTKRNSKLGKKAKKSQEHYQIQKVLNILRIIPVIPLGCKGSRNEEEFRSFID